MKHFNFKLSIILCFLVLGIGNVCAQSVYFSSNSARAQQYSNNNKNDWPVFSEMNVNFNNSYWGKGNNATDSWYAPNGYLPTGQVKEYIRLVNSNWYSADHFDWFILTYTSPSYTKTTYTLLYTIHIKKGSTGNTLRAAFFDFGDDYAKWSSKNQTPTGYTYYKGALWGKTTTYNGEHSCVVSSDTQYGTQELNNRAVTVVIDNSNGTSNIETNRYAGMSSSKTYTNNAASNSNRVSLYMRYTYTMSYYKQITYYSNDGTDNTENQAIENSGNILPASTFTRKNHIFTGWWSAASGGTKTEPGTSITVNASTKGAMNLYAQWSAVQFNFKNGATTVGSLSAQDDNSLPTLPTEYKPTAGDNKFFAGYFTEEGGKGIQVYDGSLNATEEGKAVNFEADANLYAHFVTTQHNVVWDYTYRDSEEGYKNLNEHNRNCQVQFLDKNGTAFKTVYLTAPEVTNVTDPTSSNRTTATVVLDLAVGSTTDDVTTGANAKIHFTQAELESIHSYQFDVWTTDGSTGTKAEHWRTTTNPATNTIHFNFGQLSANMFMLKWNVTLHNLNKYPDKIFAKPMILVESNYQEIDEIIGSIGEDCYMISADATRTDVGANTSRTYYGEFPVLKNEHGGHLATYKVGMTGFHLAGDNYYLHSTPGTVPDDFVSNSLQYQEGTDVTLNTITYAIHDYDIPVVQMLPANPTLGETGATINYQPMILYVDQARAKKVNLGGYVARRTHFNFLGWYDNEWKDENGENKIWGANEDYYFYTHEVNGGTRTIFALWERDTQPNASVAMEEKETGFDYTISATDLVAVKAVKYMVASEEPAADATGWTVVTANEGKYVVTIPRTNDKYGKFLYVMVENEGKYIIIKYADPIRSFIDLDATFDDKHPDANDYYTTYFNSTQAYKLVNATAYKVVVKDDKLSLANITSTEPITNTDTADGDGPATPQAEPIIPKGEAVILQGVASKITLELVDSNVANSTDNKLEGADISAQPSDVSNYDYYIFKYDTLTGFGFFMDNETQLAAHTAYLKLDKNAENPNPESYTLNFDDSTVTGINDVTVNGTSNGAIYDLLGRKVKATNAKSGIYIKDGKKILVK